MLTVKKNAPNQYVLSGVIDETVDFEKLLGPVEAGGQFFCKEVTRINSIGIKLWRDFFHSLRKKNIQVKFFELSPALTATINYLSDFISKPEITSVCAPFMCGKCNSVNLKVMTVDEAKAFSASVFTVPCPKCQGDCEFDEMPEEYFSFLEN